MKRTVIALLLVLVLAGGVVALAAAGGADDPLISLSYLLDTFRTSILDRVRPRVESALEPALQNGGDRLEALEGARLPEASEAAARFSPVSLQKGERLRLESLAAFVPTAGSARLNLAAGELIDLSTGSLVSNGSLLQARHRYLAAENAEALLKAEGGPLRGMVEGGYSLLEAEYLGIEDVFPDLNGHWGASYVEKLYLRGVVNGVAEGVFEPNGTVTRAMLVTILGRVEGVEPAAFTSSAFADVNAGAWYGPYVAWAQGCGVVQGYEDGSFRPNAPITREQMALIFQRYAAYKGLNLAETAFEPFADADAVSSWARDAVDFVGRTGLMNGKGGNAFDPKGTATRAEICAVTARFLEKTEA